MEEKIVHKWEECRIFASTKQRQKQHKPVFFRNCNILVDYSNLCQKNRLSHSKHTHSRTHTRTHYLNHFCGLICLAFFSLFAFIQSCLSPLLGRVFDIGHGLCYTVALRNGCETQANTKIKKCQTSSTSVDRQLSNSPLSGQRQPKGGGHTM